MLFFGGRVMRATGAAASAVAALPSTGAFGNARQAFAMLAASTDWVRPEVAGTVDELARRSAPAGHVPTGKASVALLEGCVQAGLYGRLNDATERTLRANGYTMSQAPGQDCCGALHAHGGDLDGARRLARRNVEAFDRAGVDFVTVNSAGCGAAMKEYGTLFEDDDDFRERAAAFSARVRDATELLVQAGPRMGASVPCSVAYDHPCHLLHAQRVESAPLDVLAAVPGVEVRIVTGADECCGGAGIYGMTHPELGGRIGRDKVDAVQAEGADLACTPNPGCMMQIGAGLRMEGSETGVVHPVELLDESYQRAGYYE